MRIGPGEAPNPEFDPQGAVFAYSDEPLRAVVHRMADSGFTQMPVIDRDDPEHVLGIVSLDDLLRARSRNLEEERARERVLRFHMPRGRNGKRPKMPVKPIPK